MIELTERERQIAGAILKVLNGMDGGQMAEVFLHGEVNLRLPRTIPRAEFDNVLSLCDTLGWVTGVQPRLGGPKKWNINDAGQAIRLELK